jgi:hypothetical protein
LLDIQERIYDPVLGVGSGCIFGLRDLEMGCFSATSGGATTAYFRTKRAFGYAERRGRPCAAVTAIVDKFAWYPRENLRQPNANQGQIKNVEKPRCEIDTWGTHFASLSNPIVDQSAWYPIENLRTVLGSAKMWIPIR